MEIPAGWKRLEDFFSTDYSRPDLELQVNLKKYFGAELDFSYFYLRRENRSIEVMRRDKLWKWGYVFVDSINREKCELEMQEIRQKYSDNGKKISRCFVDFDKGLAGFEWRSG